MTTPTKHPIPILQHTPPKVKAPSPAPLAPLVRLQQAFQEAETLIKSIPQSLQPQACEELRLAIAEFCHKWQFVDDSDLEPEEAVSEDEGEDEGPLKRARTGLLQQKLAARVPDGYPGALWALRLGLKPGRQGFVDLARLVLAGAKDWKPPSLGKATLLRQQHNVAALLHPQSPVERLLVDHNTGSGKTLLMLRVLDNYYFDARPKVAVFPKDSVCDNFYKSLLEWPTQWRDFWASQCPREATVAANTSDWRQRRHEKWDLSSENPALRAEVTKLGLGLQKTLKLLFISKIRAVLEMKRAFRNGELQNRYLEGLVHDDSVPVPAAPLRAYRFTSAGGRAAAVEDGVPVSCVFKIGFDAKDGNVYSNKVVIMDEGHHLTRPHPFYQEQLSNLRQLLFSARNTVLALCTGTMAEDSAKDPRVLLDVVKGRHNAELNDEGFLSSHHVRGAQFPREVPFGVSDGALTPVVEEQLVHHVELTGEALMRYLFQEIRFRREGLSGDELDGRLANYANMYVFASSFGNATCKNAILGRPGQYAPKMRVIADMVAGVVAKKQKVAVMISKRNGYSALLAMLRNEGNSQGFQVAELTELADFNNRRNARGEQYAVLVANTDQAAEGVEFFCVRLHILVDVPPSHGAYKQRASRSVRCLGHSDLPKEDRDVRFAMFVAQLPEYAQTRLGSFVLWAMMGMWSPTQRKSYGNAEPAAEDVEAAASELISELEARGITSLHDLRLHTRIVDRLDVEMPRKTRTRLHQGLTELQENFANRPLPSDPHLTSDERCLARLRVQAEKLAPAVHRVRGRAIDAGLY